MKLSWEVRRLLAGMALVAMRHRRWTLGGWLLRVSLHGYF
jgi:hypothetical protein